MIVVAADLARRRQARGLKLNYVEAVAIIVGGSDGSGARREERRGDYELRRRRSCPREQVMEGVAEMIHEVQVEATFPDGTKLVTIHDPIK